MQDWEAHLVKLCASWSSVALMTGRYHGTPMRAHALLSGIAMAHLDRLLEIFGRTAGDVCLPDVAALFIDRAGRIAQSVELGMALHRGQMLCPGERLRAEERS